MDGVTEQTAKPLPRLATRPAAWIGALRCCACFILVVFAAPAHAGVSLGPSATIPFEENQGQFNEQVAFAARTFGGTVFVTHDGRIVYALSADGSVGARHAVPLQASRYADGPVGANDDSPLPPVEPSTGLAIYETLVGAAVDEVRGADPAITRVSYFKGNDPKQWISGLATYQRLDFGEAYPGIRLELAAHGNNVEKRFIVAPGAQPEMIRLRVEGAQALQANAVDELEVTTDLGPVGFTAPLAYQDQTDGRQLWVPVTYDVEGDEYGFAVGHYDHNRPLVIDPLLASTLFGGISTAQGMDKAFAIALNEQGVYISGQKGIPNFPTTPGVFQEVSMGNRDLFISKFSYELRYLLASTYLGGSGREFGSSGLSLDSNGNVVVGGATFSSDFPTTPGAIGQADIAETDGVVAKLDGDLTTLLASTYLSGSQWETVVSVTSDELGQVYATGWTTSPNFPAVSLPPGAFDTTFNGDHDAFVVRLNDTFTELQAFTFLGGGSQDEARDIIRDAAGNVYVTGFGSGGFPTTAGAYDQTPNGWTDVFVSKLDPNLNTLKASTLLGGDDGDYVGARDTLNGNWYSSPLALDAGGRVLIGGYTFSHNFPTTPDVFCSDFAPTAGNEGYISIFSPDLTTLEASTFVDGCLSGGEEVLNVMPEPSGEIVVTGATISGLFPTTPGAYREASGIAHEDIFISRFDAKLSGMQVSTLFGASGGSNYVSGSALDPAGNVWLTGYAGFGWAFPTTPGAYCEDMPAGIFISELSHDLAADPPCTFNGDVSHDGQITGLDAQMAYAAALGYWIPLIWQGCAADCNGSGEVTIEDVQQIFGAALGIGQCVCPMPATARLPAQDSTNRTPKAIEAQQAAPLR